MQVGPFVLDDVGVTEARVRFERNTPYRHKDRTTFDEYLELFASDCNNFTIIGKEKPRRWRLSREMVRLIYNKYFSDLFPHRSSGRSRNRFCLLKKVAIRARELPTEECLVKEVCEVATRQGLDFKREPKLGIKVTSQELYFRIDSVRINNKLCQLHKVTKVFKSSPRAKRFYAHVHISVNSARTAEFIIVQTKIENYPIRFWIIPAAEFLKIFNDKITSGVKYIWLYLPVEKLPVYRNMKPKTDWWKYENAWYLLRGELETAPSPAIIPAQKLIPASVS